MNIKAITEPVVKIAKIAAVRVKRNSPVILMGAGTVAIIGGVIMACKATTKIDEITEEYVDRRDEIEDAKTDITTVNTYTDKDYKKDKLANIVKTGGRFVALYAPSAAVITLGISCYLGSYGIMRKRNVALVAAYNTIDKAFKDYRDRVAEMYGVPEEQAIHEAAIEKSIYEGTDDPEQQKMTQYGPYARIFDELSDEWVRNSEANLLTLRQREQWANQKLRERGHLFLNEVYDMLGLKRSSLGAQCGWMYDPNVEHKIDFGIYKVSNPEVRKFVNGYEYSIVLDFNCDGVIYDLI